MKLDIECRVLHLPNYLSPVERERRAKLEYDDVLSEYNDVMEQHRAQWK